MPKQTSIADSITAYRDAFRRSLAAENLSDRTIQTYTEAIDRLSGFLREQDLPGDIASLRREHIEAWIVWMSETRGWSGNTVKNRFRGVFRFFRWLAEMGELDRSPMEKMRVPRVEQLEVPVISDTDLQQLLRVTGGKEFRDRRDHALVLVLLDSGLRASEVTSIRLAPEDPRDSYIDLDEGVLWVMGKGRRQRRVALGKRARKAIDAYLFARARHPKSDSPYLWLGERGGIGASGLYQIIESRCGEAGIPRLHPHQFRHTFAHKLVQANVNDADIMYTAGWRDRGMLMRYGASAAAERAIEASRRASPADRLD